MTIEEKIAELTSLVEAIDLTEANTEIAELEQSLNAKVADRNARQTEKNQYQKELDYWLEVQTKLTEMSEN